MRNLMIFGVLALVVLCSAACGVTYETVSEGDEPEVRCVGVRHLNGVQYVECE